jgi:SpoVK/Ycf46/Vps4 family AAA+-type ATPase
MDEERWSQSWLNKATAGRVGKAELSQNNNESPELAIMVEASSEFNAAKVKRSSDIAAAPVEIDRYKSDMAHAEALRRGMRQRKDSKNSISEASASGERRLISEEDVLLGLRALDEADEMRHRGELESSLRVAELAMELLIEFLKSDPSSVASVDRSFVGSRVHVALSDAEATKCRLHSLSKPDQSSSKKTGIVESLSSTLERFRPTTIKKKSSTSPSSSSAIQSTGQPTASTSQQQQQQQQQLKKKSPIVNQRQQPILQQRKTSTRPSATQSSGGSTAQSAAPQPPSLSKQKSASSSSPSFLNSNDPLVATIKSDLYVDPSQLQDISWDDIAGLADAKQALQEAAILPLMRPDLFTGLRKPRNILLYGPPGTGKTMLVRAVAKESQCLLFICTASALTSKWHGEGEKLVRALFEVARAAAPSILFVDEMDALLSSRKSDGEHEASRRFKTEFMTQMDGIVKGGGGGGDQPQQHLLVIACTNTPWDIDGAILRRFARRIYVPLPDPSTRKALFQKLLLKAGGQDKHSLSKADITRLIKRTKGFSGSDIASLASEASFGPLRSLGGVNAIRGASAEDIRPISLQDFETAIDQATKSVSPKLLKQYDEWKQQQAAS